MSMPCYPKCPNAPGPAAAYSCCRCGGGIQDGGKYYGSLEGYVCAECIEDMTATEFMGLIGETFSTAEKEE